MPEPPYTSTGAEFGGPNDRYRYLLWREWDPRKHTVVFIMLNPSTADDKILDPTVRRCLGFAMAWGYGRMEILNLFALRSTDPAALYSTPEPVGWRNDVAIARACERLDRLVVAAWGAHGGHLGRDEQVVNIVTRTCRTDLYCLNLVGETERPGHPLYLKKDLCPFVYRRAL